MGLFDFLKGKKEESPSFEQQTTANDSQEEIIQYKTQLRGRELTTDAQLIKEVIDKMVAEDPFKNFYDGKTAASIGPTSQRVYEYEVITTMKVDLIPSEDNQVQLYIEGILLGNIPSRKANEIENYIDKYLLTAYVFVTGGRYKGYSEELQGVQERTEPYDLDIYLQFS